MKYLTFISLLCTLFLEPSHGHPQFAKKSATPVDVSGIHAFTPPDFDAGDVRGPCPALNALANHAYISHNGVTSLVEVVAAVSEVFNMGVDLATVLAIMGTVFVGSPISLDPGFSIGGPSPASENLISVLGLVSDPRGLTGSHNLIEADSSNTRNDLYVTGDASTMNLTEFEAWYSMSTDGTYSMELAAKRANIKFQQSIAENPNFYYGPFTGMIARNAGYLFSGRLFANYSDGGLQGTLTQDIIKSLYAVTGEEGSFVYNVGYEEIPANWYHTPVPYSLISLNVDILAFIVQYPALGSIGGNTGTVNSFTGLDIGDVTGGVLNAGTLLESNNLLCFAFEVIKTVAPESLSGVFTIVTTPLEMILNALAVPLLSLECPALADLKVGGDNFITGMEKIYPGASASSGVM